VSELVDVGPSEDFAEGVGVAVPVHGRMVAVFRVAGQLKAIDDFCPHMGASLAAGWLDGCQVSCPWHAWRFSLEYGAWLDNPRIKVDVYQAIERDGRVFVTAQPSPPDDLESAPPAADD